MTLTRKTSTGTTPSTEHSPAASRAPVRRISLLFVVGLALVLVGGAFAAVVNTDFGRVSVTDTRFTGEGGQSLGGLLYVPDGVTADSPAPAVLAVHGYVNSRETMSPVSIELARRGYVVLELDQAGHGTSAAPAFAHGYGGPAALRHLRSLDFVDRDNVGLVGHSMGGWTVLQAAAAVPDGYRSLVLMSSAPFPAGPSTGGGAAATPKGTTTFPRNTAVVVSTVEEFSGSMWQSANPVDINGAPNMESLFGTDSPVREGTVYGDVGAGTGRVLHRPSTVHAGVTHDPAAVGHVVDWFGRTLTGAGSAGGQVWWLKELGTLVAMVGGVLSVFGVAKTLARRPERPAVPAATGRGWWVAALAATAIPAITFIPVMKYAPKLFPPGAWFSQSVSNWVLAWALLNAVITAVALVPWLVRGWVPLSGVLPGSWRAAGRAVGLGAAAVGTMLGLVLASDLLFKTDFRFWVLAFRAPTAPQLVTAFCYALPLLVFFVVFSTLLNTQLRVGGRRGYWAAALVPSVGLAVLVLVQYSRFPFGGELVFPGYQLHTIVAYQVVVLLAVAGVLCVALFRWTGSVLPGAVASALLAAWCMTAGTATQAAVGEWGPVPWAVRLVLPLLAGVVLLVVAVRSRRGVTGSDSTSGGSGSVPA
ncbi:alpha/beta hydrolase family protein [Actinokineospora spheciospongiae]|uniref:alpha/beta hydrolase family protein n=1 Tax=Actinokineospora spheciospongiae TaxID=909613 RepID=UPI000D70EBD4|nr:alpha/beta fold hydrolase [Actinokineospora spheciospongiae]PWW66883.1 serine aminopeptidase S33 family [Actinokineospora spheciospongiae]